MSDKVVDLLVIGGGINGAGIARDAAGRGLSVLLCEKADLGGATSSASTKLIHGGLRYLEYYEFRLVREALMEREVLLRAAPHIIWPLRFVLPHMKHLRPGWMIRLGLFLYDNLGGRVKLPDSRGLDLRSELAGKGLKPELTRAFEYSDCWVQDARLVVLNARDAQAKGAEILTRTACTEARREGDLWVAKLQLPDGSTREVRARALVNAAGPWVSEVLGRVAGENRAKGLKLVKGSHIVVPRLYEGEHCYIFQNDDRRIVFAIPYEQNYTLIGTTDVPYADDPAKVKISQEETDYLLGVMNNYFTKQIGRADIVWTYSGVRPLYDDASANLSAVTRDYVFDIDAEDGQAPLLSIFGGKITTYRRLAEHALEKLQPHLGFAKGSWTKDGILPGGDMPNADFESYLADCARKWAWLPADVLKRYLRAYGTDTVALIGSASHLEGLGEHLGEGIYAAELAFVFENEWVRAAEDFLWRRSKMGLHVSDATKTKIVDWFARKEANEAAEVT